jgi:hypothetical protein
MGPQIDVQGGTAIMENHIEGPLFRLVVIESGCIVISLVELCYKSDHGG